MIQLILGGARSGKSRLAEQIAQQYHYPVYYIATAQVLDDEMQQRITHHQNHRPKDWQTIEQPIYLADTLQQLKQQTQPIVILVDCLTLWLSNLICQSDEELLLEQQQQLFHQLNDFPDHHILILVSNETGLGVVPLGEISRKFVDTTGFLHQQLAQIANQVMFCVAGLPMVLKSS